MNTAQAVLLQRLQQAQREQNAVVLYLTGLRFEGTIHRIENDIIQIRYDGKLTHIILEHVLAITTE